MPNVSLLTSGIGDVNQGGQLVPTGTVFAFAGTTAPSGWLLCDGAAYPQGTYPALSAVLGSTYNTQVNPNTGSNYASPGAGNFRVPDLRGLFLRGHSSGATVGGSVITAGNLQVDAMQGHRHNFRNTSSGTTFETLGFGQTVGFSSPSGVTHNGTTNSYNLIIENPSGDGSNGTPRTAPETRPMNRGVLYIIKI